MILSHIQLADRLEIKEGKVNFLVIEDKKNYREIIENLSHIEEKEYEGFMILDEKGKKVDSKKLVFVPGIFGLSLSDKRIIKAIEKRLVEAIQEEYLEWVELRAKLLGFMERMEETIEFTLKKEEFTPESLVKLMGYGLLDEEKSVLDRMLHFFAAMTDLVGIKLFVMNDFFDYLTEEEYEKIKKSIELHEFTILCLSVKEHRGMEFKNILDRDWCLI